MDDFAHLNRESGFPFAINDADVALQDTIYTSQYCLCAPKANILVPETSVGRHVTRRQRCVGRRDGCGQDTTYNRLHCMTTHMNWTDPYAAV